MKLSYAGTLYHGWQSQPNAVTVQETIEKALSLILRMPIKIVGAGRTDTGVHATQMYAHFDTNKSINPIDLTYRLNSFLPQDIAILEIPAVVPDAHARFDAQSRHYQYFIHQQKSPFLNATSWELNRPLDLDAMNQAAKALLSYTDFKSFSKTHTDVKTYICDVQQAEWQVMDHQIVFKITADRFLRNMVRAIVGTLIQVGLHQLSFNDFKQIIKARDRNQAGFSAPAKGLFLAKITYPPKIFTTYGND